MAMVIWFDDWDHKGHLYQNSIILRFDPSSLKAIEVNNTSGLFYD